MLAQAAHFIVFGMSLTFSCQDPEFESGVRHRCCGSLIQYVCVSDACQALAEGLSIPIDVHSCIDTQAQNIVFSFYIYGVFYIHPFHARCFCIVIVSFVPCIAVRPQVPIGFRDTEVDDGRRQEAGHRTGGVQCRFTWTGTCLHHTSMFSMLACYSGTL